MNTITIDLSHFSKALVSLGESISSFGRAIRQPDESAVSEVNCSSNVVETVVEAVVEAAPAQSVAAKAVKSVEKVVKPVEKEAKPAESPAQKAPEVQKAPPDRLETIRRAAARLGMTSPAQPAQKPAAETARTTPVQAARPVVKAAAAVSAADAVYGELPKRAMGWPDMEKWCSGYQSRSRARDAKAFEHLVSGRDYSLDGKLACLSKLMSDGLCVVNMRGTRYFRAVPPHSLSDLYLCPARPEHSGDVAVGDVAYVGYGMKGDHKASSYRKAKVTSIGKAGADFTFFDNGCMGTCPVSSLAVAKLVETVKPKKD